MSEAGVPEVVRRPSRLQALAALGANAETSAEALDRIAKLACRILDVPVALVNLVGADEQRFVGGGASEEPWASMRGMPITAGFCPFALGAADVYALDDARQNSALAANPAVQQFGVTAYAGVPLRTADGEPIGTLCAIDFKPRRWSDDDVALLADLAAGVIAELQLLTATRLVARSQARLARLAELSSAVAPPVTVGGVLDEVVHAVDRIEADAIWLLERDESGQALRTAAATDGELAAHHVPLTAPLAPAEVARSGEPAFLHTRADVDDRFAMLSEAMPDIGSVAVMPLPGRDRPLGVLCLCFVRERAFPIDDREYLAAVAGVSALALSRD